MPGASPDLRSFLADYEQAQPSQVWRIQEEVEPEYVTTAWVLELERRGLSPLLVFEDVRGAGMPVISNIFGSRDRIAWMLGTDTASLTSHWSSLTARLIPPRVVAEGPAQEEVCVGEAADACSLPLLKHFAGDAGRYLTSGICISNDPGTGVRNLTFARMQAKGPRRFGISFHSRGHHWDYLARYEAQGRNMPMAVAVGAHPALLLAAATRGAIETDELDVAGSLLGMPVDILRAKTIDVDVPATAELVLEGEVLAGVREPEGPFGEYTGYSTSRSTQHVFAVSAITQRRQPWYLDVTPGFSTEHLFLGRTAKEAMVLAKLREVYPAVRALHYPKSGTHFHCFVSIDKSFEGLAKQVGMLLLGLDQYVKLCVIVDADIDPTIESEVMWSMATRMQPSRDVTIVAGGLANQLDPSSRGGTSDKMIVDATRPLENWDAERVVIPPEVTQQVHAAIQSRLT
jgi:2,5-furandicarboxylate decarboxylase 1